MRIGETGQDGEAPKINLVGCELEGEPSIAGLDRGEEPRLGVYFDGYILVKRLVFGVEQDGGVYNDTIRPKRRRGRRRRGRGRPAWFGGAGAGAGANGHHHEVRRGCSRRCGWMRV